jgi:hypothetical protein
MYRTVLIVFVVLLACVLPVWPYSRAWGVQPAVSVLAIFAVLSVLKALKLI